MLSHILIYILIQYVYDCHECRVEFPNHDKVLSIKFSLIIANSADPGVIQHYAEFHMGIYLLPNYAFRGVHYTEGQRNNKFKFASSHGITQHCTLAGLCDTVCIKLIIFYTYILYLFLCL